MGVYRARNISNSRIRIGSTDVDVLTEIRNRPDGRSDYGKELKDLEATYIAGLHPFGDQGTGLRTRERMQQRNRRPKNNRLLHPRLPRQPASY
jgi:hypothetical protein